MSSLTVIYNQSPKLISEKLYEKCEYTWSYLGKIINLFRHSLSAAARTNQIISLMGGNFPKRVKFITTRMRLFSIVSVPFSCVSLKGTFQKIFKSMQLKDREGATLGLLSFTILSLDIFDSVSTFVNAALETAARQPSQALSALGLPVAYGLTILSTISRTIQIAKSHNLYKNLQKEVSAESYEQREIVLKSFLEKKFELTEEECTRIVSSNKRELVMAKKHAEILRASSPEVVEELKNLYKLLKQHKHNFKEISTALDRIQALLEKKMKVDALHICANLVVIPALCLFSLGALTATPYILLAGSLFIRISTLVYQDL